MFLHCLENAYGYFQTDERIEVKQGLGYVDYQTNMVKLAKNIAKTAQDMVSWHINYRKNQIVRCE